MLQNEASQHQPGIHADFFPGCFGFLFPESGEQGYSTNGLKQEGTDEQNFNHRNPVNLAQCFQRGCMGFYSPDCQTVIDEVGSNEYGDDDAGYSMQLLHGAKLCRTLSGTFDIDQILREGVSLLSSTNPAKGFDGDAQVGGDVGEGHPLFNVGPLAQQVEVFLLGSFKLQGDDPFL